MGEAVLKRLDEESKEFYDENYQKVLEGKMKFEDIVGFKLKKARAFIPDTCPFAVTSLYSLLPVYDVIFYPIFAKSRNVPESEKIDSIEKFKFYHRATPEDISLSAIKGRVIPYFVHPYSEYDYNTFEPFIEPGVPIIGQTQKSLILRHGLCKISNNDCEKCGELIRLGKKEFSDTETTCWFCLSIFYQYGFKKENLRIDKPDDNIKSLLPKLCFSTNVLVSRNIDAIYSTRCEVGKEALSIVSKLPDPETIDYVCRGLKINYTEDVPLTTYLDILNNKTTRAIRKTVENIMENPYSNRNRQRLNARIFEYNQEIEQFADSKAAKFYQAVADLTVYGGSKFAEETSQRYIKLNEKNKTSLSQWIAEKSMDIHAIITGKDWTLAQLYKFKCTLESCKDTTC